MSVQFPPPQLIENFLPVYVEFLQRLVEIVRHTDVSEFTSWWRDDFQNRAVGGAPDSQHLFGFAVDLISSRPEEVAELADLLGMFAVIEMDHVHIQILPAGELARLGFFGEQFEV